MLPVIRTPMGMYRLTASAVLSMAEIVFISTSIPVSGVNYPPENQQDTWPNLGPRSVNKSRISPMITMHDGTPQAYSEYIRQRRLELRFHCGPGSLLVGCLQQFENIMN